MARDRYQLSFVCAIHCNAWMIHLKARLVRMRTFSNTHSMQEILRNSHSMREILRNSHSMQEIPLGEYHIELTRRMPTRRYIFVIFLLLVTGYNFSPYTMKVMGKKPRRSMNIGLAIVHLQWLNFLLRKVSECRYS